MTRRKEDGELHKVTIRIYAGDFERLNTYYQKQGANSAIRQILHAHLARLDAQFAQRTKPASETEIAQL